MKKILSISMSLLFLPGLFLFAEDYQQEYLRSYGKLRVQPLLALPLGENEVAGWNDCGSFFDLLNFYGAVSSNTSVGITANFEYVIRGRYGIELSFVYMREVVDIEAEVTALRISGSPNFVMPMLGANYHFLNDSSKDLYAGGFIGLGVIATGWSYEQIEISKDVALGVNAGLDYYLSETWSLGASVKYTDFGEIGFSVFPPGYSGLICDNGVFGLGHMNMITFTLGAGYRFW
ncbi:MAG: outer membrane beta-barrel protein [Candidatus Latescibacteria bacterium]|nr:outer membrane beta-barrel protein [bacterium]MBD3424591.1 outer membrane beta-barrel protein [Candidatus Latescibacterota bacterium]